jgi:hypothetical protein
MDENTVREMRLYVDEYLSLYQESKKILEQMEQLREKIEPYMTENNLDALEGSRGQGRIERKQVERPILNARFTTYNVEDVIHLLPANSKKKCLVEVVDKDKLEALCKLGEVSEDVLQMKQTKTTYSFNVRINK